MSTQQQIEEKNIKIVRRSIEALNTGDVTKASEFIHPNYFNHESQASPERAKLRGPEEFVDTVKELRAAFSDLHYEEQEAIASNDKVMLLMIVTGKHTGDFFGIPPKGNNFSYQAAHISRIADDKIWKRVPKAEGKYFLLSSQSYEKSWAIEGNSLYTKYLLKGLKGVKFKVNENGKDIPYSGSVDNNGNVTPESLHDYVYNKVASYGVAEETEQVPKIKVDKSSKTILAEYPDLARPLLLTDSTWFMKEGNDYLTKGEYDNAIVTFNKAIEKKENHADAFVKKAYALSYLKKYDEAIKCFDKAIEINSDGISVWNDKAFALVNLGRHDEAIKCFDKVISINPTDELAWHGKGYSLGYLGKYDEAIQN
jgi:tetratricopeptide (TPR) repeat protein